MELNMKKLLKFLREIAPGEITESSLCYLLYLKSHTAKRLLGGEITRPDETAWYNNVCSMVNQMEEIYKEKRKAVLGEKSVERLSKQEKENLRKIEDDFETELEERYKKVGIHRLQECCYFPSQPPKLIFDNQLTTLAEAVLRMTHEFQEITGKERVLNFIRQNEGSPLDISKIEAMKDYQYHDMAKFLVDQVVKDKNAADNKEQIRIEHTEDVETAAYLLDHSGKHIGTWSFLAFNEEQEKMFLEGALFEAKRKEFSFLPGDYTLYVLNVSGLINDGLTNPLDFQELVTAVLRKICGFAKKSHGMYFKQLCINIPDPIYECLYRNVGFNFRKTNFLNGQLYVQSLIPFPSSLKTNDSILLRDLKQIYDEHFWGKINDLWEEKLN